MIRTTKYPIHAAMRGIVRPTLYRGEKGTAAHSADRAKANAGKKPAKKKAGGKKEAPPAEPEQPAVSETIQSPHVFTAEEIATKNVELQAKLDEVETLTDQKKSANADFKLRIDNAANVIKQLRNKLKEGSEPRTVEAQVTFDTKRGKKQFHHPHSGEFIREDDMTPADWQLPMFKPAPDGKGEQIAKPGELDVKKGTAPKPAAPTKPEPNVQTNVGDVLDKAAAGTQAPPILLDLTKEDWNEKGLTAAFKKAAGVAGWSKPQIATLGDQLKKAETVDKMIDTLRPHTIAPTPVAPTTPPPSDDGFPMD